MPYIYIHLDSQTFRAHHQIPKRVPGVPLRLRHPHRHPDLPGSLRPAWVLCRGFSGARNSWRSDISNEVNIYDYLVGGIPTPPEKYE